MAFIAIALLMTLSGIFQLSFMSHREWKMIGQKSFQNARKLSTLATDTVWSPKQNDYADDIDKRYKFSRVFDSFMSRRTKSKDD